MKDIVKFPVLAFIIISLLCSVVLLASAHAGKTDENGGHIDHETGEYHYHHGYPAHSHYDMDNDGRVDCPYEFDDKTGQNSGQSSGGSSTGGTRYRDPAPTSAPTAPTAEYISPPVDSPSGDATVEIQDNGVSHTSNTKANKKKFDFEAYIFSWQHFAVALISVIIVISFVYLSSFLNRKGHRFTSRIFVVLSVVLGIISIPAILLIASFLYVIGSIIVLIGHLIISFFKWFVSSISKIVNKKPENDTTIKICIDRPEVIEAPPITKEVISTTPIEIGYSNNCAYDVCKLMWIRSNIFCNQWQQNAPIRARTYLWTSFFYAITKSIRKQTIVDEIYTQFLPASDCILEKKDQYTDTLDDIKSDYQYFADILNASDIDPRTNDGIEELWDITSCLVFPDCLLPNNAIFGFRYNVNLLTNHALIKYQLKKAETIYYLEAKNGMTVRVPESKLEAWTAAQESDTPRMSEEQRKALADRIVQEIYHPKSE